MDSILQEDMNYCYKCGRYGTEVHHVFYGVGNRSLSTRYKLLIGLCYNHHRGKQGVHNGNRELDMELKHYAQRRFQEVYPDVEFLAVFGRNYLFD